MAAVLLFAAWLAFSNLFLNPSYTAAAPFHAAFIVGGFFVGRRMGAGAHLFGAALVFAACLALWAIWQRTGGGLPRASALFETPATLAAVLNLVLLPGVVLVALGNRRPWMMAGLLVVAAGVVAATSRGGWAALLLGALTACVLAWHARTKPTPASLARAAALLGLGVAAIVAAGAFSPSGATALGSTWARFALFEFAIDALAWPSLFAGQGYLSFYYVLEAGKATLPEYAAGGTYFVHNDYLQTLLELGVVGLVLLLALVALPLLLAWRSLPSIAARKDRARVIALCAGLASMASHAVADFPFYVPVCLLMYGATLGMLEERLAAAGSLPVPGFVQRWAGTTAMRAIRAAVVTVAAWVLVVPVAAEAAAAQAHRAWQGAQGERAAYWFEVARRIEPKDWRYHWYAGQFWLAQALQNRRVEAVRRADDAFADGIAANPREGRNRAGRMAVQAQFRTELGVRR